MKTLIGTIAVASMTYLVAFPAAADTSANSEPSKLVNQIETKNEMTPSEKAWERASFYTSFGAGE